MTAPDAGAARLNELLNVSGDLPPNVALMQLISAAPSENAARSVLRDALGDPRNSGSASAARAMLALWERRPEAFMLVKRVLAEADHAAGAKAGDAVAHWAGVFDKVAQNAPGPASALYALGDRRLLAAATAEIAAWMRDRALLGADATTLDLGCGSGRVVAAIAGGVRAAYGIDVSSAMLRHARQACASHRNVILAQTGGRDLAAFRDASFDLVYAVDSFPYLVLAGGDLAARHVAEAWRLLKPGGSLVMFNFSYRGDDALDRREVEESARASGFVLLACGDRPFSLWDGRAYHLRREDA